MDDDKLVEERVEDLLSRMTLEEKVTQLKARGIMSWKIFFDLFRGLPEDRIRRLQHVFFSALRKERELLGDITANYVKKHWRECLGKNGVGMLTVILRYLSPKESAELHNEIQRFAVKETRLGIPVMIHDECLHGCMAKGCTIFPQSIALASTWNPELMEEVATASPAGRLAILGEYLTIAYR